MRAPGWTHFDADVVAQLHGDDPAVVDKSPEGGMRCPLAGHDDWLKWDADGYKKGTQSHGEPPMRFRVSPTYILEDPLRNFIAGQELVAGALRGDWKKAETHRVGYENSEDALSWNVFRSLQEAGQLHLAAKVLAGVEVDAEPELILWGQRIISDATMSTPEIQRALDQLEPGYGQQTEPDVVLRIPGWGWIFIEAKLSSPTSTYAGNPAKITVWRNTYATRFTGLFDPAGLAAADPKTFPEQLLRNVAVAHAVANGQNAVVIALVRRQYAPAVEGWGNPYLAPDAPVATGATTWEELYAALPTDDARLSTLRGYLEHKSVGLRRALDLT